MKIIHPPQPDLFDHPCHNITVWRNGGKSKVDLFGDLDAALMIAKTDCKLSPYRDKIAYIYTCHVVGEGKSRKVQLFCTVYPADNDSGILTVYA